MITKKDLVKDAKRPYRLKLFGGIFGILVCGGIYIWALMHQMDANFMLIFILLFLGFAIYSVVHLIRIDHSDNLLRYGTVDNLLALINEAVEQETLYHYSNKIVVATKVYEDEIFITKDYIYSGSDKTKIVILKQITAICKQMVYRRYKGISTPSHIIIEITAGGLVVPFNMNNEKRRAEDCVRKLLLACGEHAKSIEVTDIELHEAEYE